MSQQARFRYGISGKSLAYLRELEASGHFKPDALEELRNDLSNFESFVIAYHWEDGKVLFLNGIVPPDEYLQELATYIRILEESSRMQALHLLACSDKPGSMRAQRLLLKLTSKRGS